MQDARRMVDVEWLDERDHAGVEGSKVDDRAGDVAELQFRSPAPRRYRDPAELFGFDGRGDRCVAEQRVGDAELGDYPPPPIAKHGPTGRQHSKPANQPSERATPRIA